MEELEESENKNKINDNNIINSSESNNDNKLPMLSDKIKISIDIDYIKPPIYQNELTTQKNYDDIDIKAFSSNLSNLLIKVTEIKNLIDSVFSEKNKYFMEFINSHNIPYMNFFYDLLFIIKELNIVYILTNFKYSENSKNIDSYNLLKNKIIEDHKYNGIDNFLQTLKIKNKIFNETISENHLELLKGRIEMLLEEEKKMFDYYDNIEFIPGLRPISICFDFIEMIIIETKKSLNEMKDSKYKEEHLIMNFLNNLSKVDSFTDFINTICWSYDINDVLNQKENDSLIWKAIKQHYIKYNLYKRDIINKAIDKILDFVKIGYASINKAKSNINSKLKLYTSFGMYSTLYFFQRKKAQTGAKDFLMKPELDALLTVWGMIDNPIFLELVKIVLPSVKFKQSFYIKRTQKEIDINLIEALSGKTSSFNYFDEEQNKEIHDLFMGERDENNLNDDLPLIKEKNEGSKTDENFVKIKVYYFGKMKFNSKIKNKNDIDKVSQELKKGTNEKKTIMIHVHGGGFVAMSPKSHENYTLKWANYLKIPIFSIDYRLSPGVAFPKSLDDVYQSYLWILNYSEIFFNIKFDEIILAGDSAGGNLILSLTYLLIMNKIKLPKAIFLFYPALKIDINTLVPSYLNSINDLILEYHLLKFCIESYCGKLTDNGKIITDTRNQFLSPLFMDNNILKLLPPVRIFGGSCDPLRDDSFYLMEKLLKLNKDVYFYEFKYFPHGYLNYDFKMVFPEMTLINDIIMKEIEKFI